MITFFKRQNAKPTKVTIYVEIDQIHFPSRDGLDLQPEGTFFSAVFQRSNGGIVYTSGRKAVVDARGHVTAEFDETLSQNVTLYRETTGSYQEKLAKLIVRRRIKAGNFDECFQRVGVATLNLHQYAKSNKPERYKLPITKSDVEGGEVSVVVTVRFLGDPVPNESGSKGAHRDDDDGSESNLDFSVDSGAFRNPEDDLFTESEKAFRSKNRPNANAVDPFAQPAENPFGRQPKKAPAPEPTLTPFDAFDDKRKSGFNPFPPTLIATSPVDDDPFLSLTRRPAPHLAQQSRSDSFAAPASAPPPIPLRDRSGSGESRDSDVSLTESEKAFRDSRRPAQAPEEEIDPFDELTNAIAAAEASSSIFKRRPTTQPLTNALAKLSRDEETARHFSKDQSVSQPLKEFIESPSFASLSRLESSDGPSPPPLPPRRGGTSGLPPPLPAKPTDKQTVLSEPALLERETKSEPAVVSKPATKATDPPAVSAEHFNRAMELPTSSPVFALAAHEASTKLPPSRHQPQAGREIPSPTPSPQQTPQPASAPFEAEIMAQNHTQALNQAQNQAQAEIVLSDAYEAQAQQAAYMAMQAQVDAGVTYSSEREQQNAYLAYYGYYQQYYVQLQQQTGQNQEQMQMQMMLAELNARAESAESELEVLRRELQTARQTAGSSSSPAAMAAQQAAEISALKQELSALKSKESLHITRGQELETWKSKCESLRAQLGSASSAGRGEALSEQLAAEREQTSKLKDKIKKYAERIGAMEVVVAEAHLIKSEQAQGRPQLVSVPTVNKVAANAFDSNDEPNLM